MEVKSYSRIVGVLFLCQFIIGILYNQTLVGNFIFSGEEISEIVQHKTSIYVGVLLHLLGSIGSIFGGLLLFQLLQKYNFIIAAWYTIFVILAFFIHFLNGIEALIICDFESLDSTTRHLVKERYYWTHMLGLILPLFSFPAFFYLLYKHHLIPKWISGIGFIGSFLMPATVITGLLGLGEQMFLMLPLGIAQLSLSIYLIIYGIKNYNYA